MFAVILFLILLLVISAGLALDHLHLRRRRTVAQGLKLLSARAGRHLRFREPQRDDREFFVAMASDPTAAEANGWDGNEAAVVAARFASRKTFEPLRRSELVVVERASGTRIGTASFRQSPIGPPGSRSIGIHVRPDHRGKGYGRDIMAGALLLAKQSPGPIFVGTRVTNAGMQRIMDQLGYEPDPTLTDFVGADGQHYEARWYPCGDGYPDPAGLAVA